MWHLTALFLMTLCVPAAGAPEPVEFGQDGLRLKGYLYRPAGNGPFPAIVALHNCEGLGEGGSPVATRYGDWGERLAAGGFVVLFPDSFGARGLGAAMHRRASAACAPGRERVADADAARRWLQAAELRRGRTACR